MLHFMQLSSFTNTSAFQPLKYWTPDGAALPQHLIAVSVYVARCTIWVGPPVAPSPDAAKPSAGSFLDSITRMQEVATSVVSKSQMADILVVSELSSIILSCSFAVDCGGGSASGDAHRYFSFSMVFDLSLLNSLQPVLYALSDRINRLSRFFEAIMTQTGPHNLEEYIAACDNTVKRAMDYTCRLIQPRVSDLGDFSQTMFITDPRDTEFWEFMCLCATSFLFTQRRAVVFSIEKSKHEEVNEIIRVLASLCSAEQLQYSTLLVQEQRFIPDLYLQGLDEMPLQDDLFECANVVTLIDLDQMKVRRYTSESFEEKKHERIDSEAHQIVDRVSQKLAANQSQKSLEDLHLSSISRSSGDSAFISPRSTTVQSAVSSPGFSRPLSVGNEVPDDALYGGGHPSIDEEREITDMDAPSEFIKQMIHRVLQAPPILRKAVLQQGLRVLQQWSLFLISYLPKTMDGDDGLSNHKGLKLIQSDLGILNEADFHLFLHTADACRPGFYSSILNNPKAVGKLVLDLFESF